MALGQALGPGLKNDNSAVAIRDSTWLLSALEQFRPFAQTKTPQSSLKLLIHPNAY